MTDILDIAPADVLCIYHGNCADGFGAAWVVWRYFGQGAQFHAGHYGKPAPDIAGKHVFIVDFSYPRELLTLLAAQAASITVLDHHKSARDDLAGLPPIDNLTVVFDMDHSGARLAWRHFFPHEETPPLLLHIEDRDLWRFDLPGTREIQAALFSHPYDFVTWDRLMQQSYLSLGKMIAEGTAIERKHHKDIAELLAVTQRTMTIGGHTVPVANLPYTMSSEAGQIMAKGQPFAACYWDTPEGRTFSLRSSDAGEDVSAIAQHYGGGGHRNASGFRVPYGHGLAPTLAEASPAFDRSDIDGYVGAFHQIADVLGIGAQPISPKQAFEQQMLPRIKELVAVAAAQAVPSYQTLLNMLMEANDMLRSCFQVAERMAVMFGAENGANWNALHGQLDKALKAQHVALRAEFERRAEGLTGDAQS